MYYKSTRNTKISICSAEAIKMGISPDGGLFVPETIVKISLNEINKLVNLNYQERAIEILKYLLTDYTVEEIHECVNNAYTSEKFDDSNIAPIVKINEHVYVLELWHGITCAFKDMALQILPHLLVKAIQKTNELSEIIILVATSGDTGKAALEGFKNIDGTKIIVFYPQDGVSEIQKRQMITQEGDNVYVIGVNGNFDDAQNGVKAIFADKEINEELKNKGYKFSSANSINWGRLVPQIVYYFSAYADLLKNNEVTLGEKINFAVPTGNFGNILAAYYAKEMGLPINKLICASNNNNVLTDFINTGIYNKNREFKKTISPSMDILISSNLERLLFELTEHDTELINNWTSEFKIKGIYTVNQQVKQKISELFWAEYSNESETLKTIKSIYEEYSYVVDTHTAVAIDVYDKYVISTGDMTKTVIVSTASPFKFNESVVSAIFSDDSVKNKSEFELLDILAEKCGFKIPKGLQNLEKKEILHKIICDKYKMKEQVKKILSI